MRISIIKGIVETLLKDLYQCFSRVHTAGLIAIYFKCFCILHIGTHAIFVAKQNHKDISPFSNVSKAFIQNTHMSLVLEHYF